MDQVNLLSAKLGTLLLIAINKAIKQTLKIANTIGYLLSIK
jgi:hypothetical protein